jgi:hypothetical protein
MATLCDFLVKLLHVTPAPDQDPGSATDQDQGPATNFQGEDASKDKKGKGKAVVVDGGFERPLDHSTALALPKVVITELLDGHRCQCFECNPNIKEDLKRQAVKATREVGFAELKEETRNLQVQKSIAEVRDEARETAREKAKTNAESEVHLRELEVLKKEWMSEMRLKIETDIPYARLC